MLKKNCREIVFVILLTFCLSNTATPANKFYKLPDKNLSVQNERAYLVEEYGVKKAVFNLKEGEIRLHLPDDLSAGDTISGTVSAFPQGKDEAEKLKHSDTLSGYVIDIEDERESVGKNIVKFHIPENLKDNRVNLVVRNAKGKSVAELEFAAATASDERPEARGEYQIPHIGQAGRNINITGEFDGDLENTECLVGDSPAKAIAESPRKTVFESPTDVIGPTELKLTEGFTEIVQEFRNVGVGLSAGKLNLTRGETTDLQITVSGLQGITDEIPLNLHCTGSANMSGGNIQNLQISPNEVQADGTVTNTRTLTGVQTGNFNVTANVVVNAKPKNLSDQIVHIERDPVNIGDENDKVWWMKVKTLDGRIIDIYMKQDFKPNLKFCDWIEIKETGKDETGTEIVTNYQPVDDPTKPCTLTDQTVHVEGDPLKLPDGRWQVKVKTLDGKIIYIYLRSNTKPDLRFCKWIILRNCKKLSSNSFEVGGYDETEDPTKKKPPAPAKTPTPTPTPTPEPPPVATVKPCQDGEIRKRKVVTKTFELLEEDSYISMELSTDKGANNASNMAEWLRGAATLGGYLEVPEGARGGAAVADAALKYLEVGADILSALGKSGLGNKRVLEVRVSIFITTKKVTAICESKEVCVNGAWVQNQTYSESSKKSNVRKEIRIDETLGNDWGKIVDPSTRTFDPVKFESFAKELLKKEIDKLKKNGEDYDRFKEKCR